jgi:hypothetical protein
MACRIPLSLLAVSALCGLALGIVAFCGSPPASSAAPLPPRMAAAPDQASQVDVELVLAVDVSYSMDPDEQKLQRDGYVVALTSPEFLNALREGANGKIAITYVEWAGAGDQLVLVPWRLIDGRETATAVANEIAHAPYRRAMRTSIAGALGFTSTLFGTGGYKGLRRVIDVSGDGANNSGPLVVPTRDEVLSKGITINGLPIMLKRERYAMDIAQLDIYYADCVTGGPGSFVVPIRELAQFREATREKLIQEVAGRIPPERVIPVSSDKPRISCTIGEQMWQQRWGRWSDP